MQMHYTVILCVFFFAVPAFADEDYCPLLAEQLAEARESISELAKVVQTIERTKPSQDYDKFGEFSSMIRDTDDQLAEYAEALRDDLEARRRLLQDWEKEFDSLCPQYAD